MFVTGATGALGRHLVPGLVAAGHEVIATTRRPGKIAQLRAAGAEPVIMDGLDREAVITAVQAAAPEVVVHQMTALGAALRRLLRAGRVGLPAGHAAEAAGAGDRSSAGSRGTRAGGKDFRAWVRS